MLSPMPFGNYGEFATNDEMVGFDDAILRLLKKYNISKQKGRAITKELLDITKDYLQRVNALSNVTDESKKTLETAVLSVRKKLKTFLVAPSS